MRESNVKKKKRFQRLVALSFLTCLLWTSVLNVGAVQPADSDAAGSTKSVNSAESAPGTEAESVSGGDAGSGDAESVSGGDAVSADIGVDDSGLGVSLANEAEEGLELVDLSDMVYQAGGWGIPAEEAQIQSYTIRDETGLKAEIRQALLNEASELDVRKYDLSVEDWCEAAKLVATVVNEDPGLFYVAPTMRYTYSGEQIISLLFDYRNYLQADWQAYDEKIEQAVALVTPGMTDEEKALVLHDFLAQNCAYAYREYLDGTLDQHREVFSNYGALVEGRAVCQGYAVAYDCLLHTVGINSFTCVSREMNHAWNMVQIDGQWYHVDVTWDDPVWDLEGRVRHEYFLLSDAEMSARKHSGWESDIACTSVKYDSYWWRNVDSQIAIAGGSRYYITAGDSGKGFQLNARTGDNVSIIYSNPTAWEVWNGGGWTWRGAYAYLSRRGDTLYFNDKQNLYSLKLSGGEPQVVYTYTGGDGYIYGAMVYKDKTARLSIDTSPSRTNDNYIAVSLKNSSPGTVDGIVRFPGNKAGQVMVQIVNGAGQIICETKADSSGEYELQNVAPGTYIMRASKPLYVTRDYSLTVGSHAVTMDIELRLPGDVTGDGVVDARDKKVIFSHMERALLAGYEFQVGDVDGSGRIDARDKKMIYNHIAGYGLLW